MRNIALFLCILLLLSVCIGCSAKQDNFEQPVNFYYCKNEISYHSVSGVIAPEIRDGAGFHGNLSAFMHAYLRGPESAYLQTWIPSDVYLVSCEVADAELNLVFSSQFAKLSGVKLTTVCSAILLSLHDYTGIQILNISAKDTQLDEKDVLRFSMDDVILIDTVTIDE